MFLVIGQFRDEKMHQIYTSVLLLTTDPQLAYDTALQPEKCGHRFGEDSHVYILGLQPDKIQTKANGRPKYVLWHESADWLGGPPFRRIRSSFKDLIRENPDRLAAALND